MSVPAIRIYIQPGCATPEDLVRALLGRARELENVEIIHLKTLGCAEYSHAQYEGHLSRSRAVHRRERARGGLDGRADYMPIFLHEIEGLFESGECLLDFVFLQVSPPDKFGYVRLGVCVDCTLTAARQARYAISEVNPNMPRALGQSFLHVSELDRIVEVNHPLPELHAEPATAVQMRIAENVASLIPNEATLQLGIGAVPDAVLRCLTNHNNLGLHTEMFSDGVIPLIEKGVMTGAANTLHPGKLVAGFVLGTRRLFDFIDDNPTFEFRPIKYVNDPFVISQPPHSRHQFNLQVDSPGRSARLWHEALQRLRRAGGFHPRRGPQRGRQTVIALPSTARRGTISRSRRCWIGGRRGDVASRCTWSPSTASPICMGRCASGPGVDPHRRSGLPRRADKFRLRGPLSAALLAPVH